MATSDYVMTVLFLAGLTSILTVYLPFSPMTIDLVNFTRATQLRIYRSRRRFWILGAIMFGSVGMASAGGMASMAWFWGVVAAVTLLAFMFWSGYVPYVMTPPEDQRLLSAGQASALLAPEDAVLGIVYEGEPRAYPRDFIARPHYFTDVIKDVPITVSYCILCNSGAVFKSKVGGRLLNLRSVTAFNNNIIFHDIESGNFIQQLDGRVISGPDEGLTLEPVPVIITTWKEWVREHPQTTLYYAPPRTLRDRMVAGMLQFLIPIRKLSRRSKPWHRIQGQLDTRLPAMSFVFGVEINGDRCAYPVGLLGRLGVCNDNVGTEPVLLLYDAARGMGNMFSRRLDGAVLSFERAGSSMRTALARDLETGSTWDLQGACQDGVHKGKVLKSIPHFNHIFWFSWALFKPGTRVFEHAAPAPVRTAA